MKERTLKAYIFTWSLCGIGICSTGAQTIQFADVYHDQATVSQGNVSITTPASYGDSVADYQYLVTDLNLDNDGTPDSLEVNVRLVASGVTGATLIATDGFAHIGVTPGGDQIQNNERITFSITSITAILSNGETPSVDYDFTQFTSDNYNGANNDAFIWSANSGAENTQIGDAVVILPTDTTTFYVEGTSAGDGKGTLDHFAFEITLSDPQIEGSVPPGSVGDWIGTMIIPTTGSKTASDTTVDASIATGTEKLRLRSLVGLGQEELGDVNYRIRIGFDNGTSSEGVAFPMDSNSDDAFTVYESHVYVPSGAERLTSVELIFQQNDDTDEQTAYVDDVSVAFSSGYGGWKTIYGIDAEATDDSDEDNDSIDLLLEYALDLDPGEHSTLTGKLGAAFVDDAINGSTLELTYRPERADLTYTVESSTTLEGWDTADVDQGTVAPDGTVTASTEANTSRKFLQLKVEHP